MGLKKNPVKFWQNLKAASFIIMDYQVFSYLLFSSHLLGVGCFFKWIKLFYFLWFSMTNLLKWGQIVSFQQAAICQSDSKMTVKWFKQQNIPKVLKWIKKLLISRYILVPLCFFTFLKSAHNATSCSARKTRERSTEKYDQKGLGQW